MATDDGGPAFPASEWHYESQQYLVAGGMSMRDYFAAKAMPELLSRSNELEGRHPGEKLKDSIARLSYDMADAMLKARSM